MFILTLFTFSGQARMFIPIPRKCGQYCPHLNKIVHIFWVDSNVHTNIVHIFQVDLNVHTNSQKVQTILSTFSKQTRMFILTLFTFSGQTRMFIPIPRKCGQYYPHLNKIVHIFWVDSNVRTNTVHIFWVDSNVHTEMWTILSTFESNCPHLLEISMNMFKSSY